MSTRAAVGGAPTRTADPATGIDEHSGDHAKLRRQRAAAREVAEEAGYQLDTWELKGEEIAEENFDDATRLGRAAQLSTVITVVAIGVTAIIGILVYSQVEQSLDTPENEDLANSSDSVTEGFGSAMDLVPTVLIVMVAALVIGVVQRLRG